MTKLMPAGLDQQGRYETRPIPAEAATEVGADDSPRNGARWGVLLVLLGWPVVFVIGGALVAIFA